MHQKSVCMFVYNNFKNDARVLKEARTLVENGYQVSVIAVLDDTTEPYEVRDGIHIYRIKKDPIHIRFLRSVRRTKTLFLYKVLLFPIMLILAPIILLLWLVRRDWRKRIGSMYTRKLRPLLLKVNHVCYNLMKKALMKFHLPLSFLDFYIRSSKVAVDLGADIFHAHDLNTLPVAYWSKKKTRAKLVYDSHELYVERNRLKPPTKLGKYVLRRMEKYYIRRCDSVITVNESLAEILAQRYGIRKPYVVMNTPSHQHTGDHLTQKSLRDILQIPEDYYLLLYLGSMTFNRGLENLIASMKYLPNCYLVFMGYGAEHYKEKLAQTAIDHGVKDRFAFFGPVPSDEVTAYAVSADIGVAPIENVCLSYYYCSPNKVFECLNAGLPVIASDFPELKRVIEAHDIGTTFEPSNPQDIARAAKAILDNPEDWARMKRNTIPASKYYNWENEAKVLIDLYRSVG